MDDTRAACARLPMSEVDELFYLEGAPSTARWPRRDTHAKARIICASCPLLAECARTSFTDAYSFRGGMSPEERASFGGVLPSWASDVRRPRFSREEVWSRLEQSPLPREVMWQVLSAQVDRAGATIVRSGLDDWTPAATRVR